jgi:hypothetical protein
MIAAEVFLGEGNNSFHEFIYRRGRCQLPFTNLLMEQNACLLFQIPSRRAERSRLRY